MVYGQDWIHFMFFYDHPKHETDHTPYSLDKCHHNIKWMFFFFLFCFLDPIKTYLDANRYLHLISSVGSHSLKNTEQQTSVFELVAVRELLLTEECQGDWSDCKGNVVHCIWTMNDPVRRWALSKSSQQGISLLLYSSADSSCQSLYTPQIFMTLPTVGRVFVYSDDFELFYHSISIHHAVDNVEILSPCWQNWIMPSSWWRIGDMTAMGFLHYVFCFFFFFSEHG